MARMEKRAVQPVTLNTLVKFEKRSEVIVKKTMFFQKGFGNSLFKKRVNLLIIKIIQKPF